MIYRVLLAIAVAAAFYMVVHRLERFDREAIQVQQTDRRYK